MKELWNSRKFKLVLLDVVASTIIFFINRYASPDSIEVGLFLIGLYQPVIMLMIKGITDEDVAAYAAGVHPNCIKHS